MKTKAFFDPTTFTLTYVVFDQDSKDAVIIDPVLDFDALTWRTATDAIDSVKAFVAAESLNVRYVLDTHAHADHLSGMEAMKEDLSAKTAIGEHITGVQTLFAGAFNFDAAGFDGALWDTLLADDDTLNAGSIAIKALHTPGHTPACMSFVIGDAVYTGDALFMPDYGTGRCDFPKGSASDLYDSVTEKLYTMADSTRVFVGHDYQPDGRELAFETTIADSKRDNIRLKASTTKDEFVSAREARDAELAPPKLILQSLQVNIGAGKLPPPESNGRVYFKMPINFLGS